MTTTPTSTVSSVSADPSAGSAAPPLGRLRAHPLLREPLRLLRLRDLDRPVVDHRRLRRRLRHRPATPRRRGRARDRRRACSSAAARPSLLDAVGAAPDPRRDPPRRGRRGDRRVQPRQRRRREAGRLRGRGREPAARSGSQSMRPHVLAALGRTHEPANVARAVDAARAVGIEPLQPRPHLRRAQARRSTTGRATLDGVAGPRPAPRQRLRAHRRARHPARTAHRGRRTSRPPTTTTRPRSTSWPTPRSPRRPRLVRDLELGPTRRRVPPQPPLLGPGRLRRHRLRRARATAAGARTWNVRTARALHRAHPRRQPPRRRRRAARPHHPGRGGARRWPCGPATAPPSTAGAAAVEADALPRPGSSAGRRPARAHPPRPAPRQPRSRCGCWPPAPHRPPPAVPPDPSWHSVGLSANHRQPRKASDTGDGTSRPGRARRAQSRNPEGGRRGVRRDRPAGRLADHRPRPRARCRAPPCATT